jgi:hypothetical protein
MATGSFLCQLRARAKASEPGLQSQSEGEAGVKRNFAGVGGVAERFGQNPTLNHFQTNNSSESLHPSLSLPPQSLKRPTLLSRSRWKFVGLGLGGWRATIVGFARCRRR